ncbi:MAG: D-sedoheptulose 7-phosphate isomerase [Flavobacteriia bacterium]|nr:D-sedoheptulose 7-phosphate isomerase [Flavobacteriia bacterium]
MKYKQIADHFIEASEILQKFNNSENFEKIEKAGQIMLNALKNNRKIISCGNGGSMCDAMHFAEELSGRYKENRPALAALSISDPCHLSCVANDYGYDFVFSRFIEAHGNEGDVFLGISTSGNSKNVINAIEIAKNKGLKTVVLTGKDGGVLAKLADLEIRAPYSKYADRAQEIHIKVIHSLIDYIEINLFG